MNPENLRFLQDRLFYLGTEKKLFPELEKNIAEGKPEFTLAFSNHYDKDKLSANLQFRKSENSEMYFLNKYEATIQKPGQQSRSHTFYLENGKGITMKEAYNLLDGRAINKDMKNKENVTYNAWVKLDFDNKEVNGSPKMQTYHKNYGYDLQNEILKLPLAPMSTESYNQLVASLERGNLQQVKMTEGAGGPFYIAANPQFKTFDIFDEAGRALGKEQKKDLLHVIDAPKTEEHTASREMVREPDQKEQKTEEKKSSLKTPKKKEDSLLPKKRTGHKKGMSL